MERLVVTRIAGEPLTAAPTLPRDVRAAAGMTGMAGFILTIGAIALSAGAALAVSTRWGIGLTPDSIDYIAAATRLLDGRGLTGLAHFPPLYPAAIAALAQTGLTPADAARWLQVLLFPVNITLVAWLAYRVTGGARAWACIAALLTAAGSAMVGIHIMGFSEPLFVALELTALLALSAYLRQGAPMRLLVLAAVATAAAMMTRYAGMALLPALLAAVLWLGPSDRRRRLRDAAILVLLASAPIGLWLLRNSLSGAGTGSRTLAFHLISADHVESALTELSLWLFPRDLRPVLRCLLIGALLGMGIEAARRQRRSGDSPSPLRRLRSTPLIALMLLFALGYVALLIVSITFVDFYTPLDTRILSPLYPVALVLALDALRRLIPRSFESPRGRRAALAALLLLAGLQMVRGADLLVTSYRDGGGFARRTWQQSRLLERVRALPPETVIYSNGADVITMLTGRRASALPRRYDATTGRDNADFVQERNAMRAHLRQSRGVVVYFRRIHRAYHPSETYLRQRLYLKLSKEYPEGAIYKTGPSGKR